MLLSELLFNVQYTGTYNDVEVSGMTADSRLIKSGNVFVCIEGARFDGHDKAKEAEKLGCVCVVAQRDVGVKNQVIVENTRSAYAIMCSNYYGRPVEKLKLIGVTGTNGKTTTTNIIKGILEQRGEKVGLIGTIENEIDGMKYPAKYTTPDPLELHLMFKRMADAGCGYAVMEVSSHALDQNRLDGCRFAVAVFTNLTQDHLDYHGNMENYYLAKKKLFSMCDKAVINVDDEYGARLYDETTCEKKSFSIKKAEADYTAYNISFNKNGSNFEMVSKGNIGRVKFCMPGEFSVSNAMAAGVCALSLGMEFKDVVDGLNNAKRISGRAEILDIDEDFTVIRDYAHSPDSIEKILKTIREFATGRVIALFGCAGNRDRTKRCLMAKAASEGADYVVLTSDNPRDEDPERIIEDAKPGLDPKKPYKIIADRYQAIKWVLDFAKKDDIIALLGKGHEDYQVLGEMTVYFDEKEIVEKLLSEKKRNGANTQEDKK